ncbi:16S rRNA (uracil(1498)-N(3))-methyltransferase [Omnitrophica bacterium]|nr:16S rRNA (uracil(1498)-N(3))-methyltransferase [Candidatus Omnitrophota bacterium]
MSRFYVEPGKRSEDKLYVDGKEAHHILDVMRLKKGDRVSAFDGTGREYFGTIEEVAKKGLIIKIDQTREKSSKKDHHITLAQSIPRREKMDYIVQKAAELGADKIIPMITQRTVVRLKKEKIPARLKRYRELAREAAKQCGSSSVTAIEDCLKFHEVLEKAQGYDLSIIPSVGHVEKKSLKEKLSAFRGRSILILIGPEGGFDPAELEAASKKEITFVSLGENVLKCDTAALAAIAMINYALSDI